MDRKGVTQHLTDHLIKLEMSYTTCPREYKEFRAESKPEARTLASWCMIPFPLSEIITQETATSAK